MRFAPFRGIIRRVALVAGLACALAPGASAQHDATPVKASIEELTAQWASLELPLLGISNLTDLQRDAIEILEEKYRKLFNDESGPIRAARITLYQRGPFEQHLSRHGPRPPRRRECPQLHPVRQSAVGLGMRRAHRPLYRGQEPNRDNRA